MSKAGFRTALFATLAALALAPGAVAKPPTRFNALQEAQNYSITLQRAKIYGTPGYQAQLALDTVANGDAALAAESADPGREFVSDLCWNGGSGCAGDIRLNNWAADGDGIVRPVLFTARNGATLSGHVWATVAGPARRPGIVIVNGSVQADEQMYWYAAQALAKAGFVVLTFDPQGQGQSDTLGEGRDGGEGVPAQTTGTPFYDGAEDALNFFLSNPSHPYEPVPSCTTGTSHAAKQNQRAAAGLDAAYDPLWQLLDPAEVGLAGHSYGAAGVSYIAQWDPRVKAVVAWDNLGGPGANASPVPGGGSGKGKQATIGEAGCPHDPAARRTVPLRVPGLGISADYGLPPTPNLSLPNPDAKSTWSLKYSQAKIPSGEIVTRGGSHLDFSWIPLQALGASYYGPDLIDWYTTAWFMRYLMPGKGVTADRMLISNRWRDFAPEAAIDPNHDADALSFYYHSRLDFQLSNRRWFDCEDLRDGCAGMQSATGDGYRGAYDYVKIDTSRDAAGGPAAAVALRSDIGLIPCRTEAKMTQLVVPPYLRDCFRG